MKMLQRIYAKIDENEKKIELMATAFQIIIQDTPKEDGKKRITRKGKMMGNEKQVASRKGKKVKKMFQKFIHD